MLIAHRAVGRRTPRALRGLRRRSLLRRVRPDDPRPPLARALDARASRSRATYERVGLELSLGTQASDRMVGEPTTFTKAWFDAFPEAADATPLLTRRGRSRPSRRSSGCGSPTRSPPPRWSTWPRLRARDEGERGGRALAGLRSRRRHRLERQSSSRSGSRSSGRGRGSAPSRPPATDRCRRTSRRCSRSGSAPTAIGATTRRTSAPVSSSLATTSCSTAARVYNRASTTSVRVRACRARPAHPRRDRRRRIPGPADPSDRSRRRRTCARAAVRASGRHGADRGGNGSGDRAGAYWEGGGGLRVEDNFLITADGAEKLSCYPDDFR